MKRSSSLPAPVPGLVVRYSYLWRSEHLSGQEEGRKDRPCAIVISLDVNDDGQRVMVLPITHTPPSNAETAVEIPHSTKHRLGLDDERSWIVISEANLFRWPGPDLRPTVNGDLSTVVYGLLPYTFFREIRDRFVKALRERTSRVVPRSE
ncbi:MAG: type II toxin-antitoxin system PemK/MazF family toxin [Mesorhizobium sp.]